MSAPVGFAERLGRFGRCDDRDTNQIRFSWSGSGFGVRFAGRSLRVRVAGSAGWLRVELDGAARALEVAPSTEWIEIGQNLSGSEHSASVRLRTEPLVGELVLSGLDTDGRFLSPLEPNGPRIEFLGDSITCGYGVHAPDETHGFSPSTEDWFASYAGIVERRLDADVHCVAWSGRGLVRNFDPDPLPTMPDLHPLAHPGTGAAWEASRWVPDLVVVNLGSNDLFRAPPPDRSEFLAAWVGLVGRILSRSDDVKAVLLDGPLVKDGFPFDQAGRPLTSLTFLRGVLDEVAGIFDTRRVFRFSLSPVDPSLGWGADSHPSRAQQERNGNELADFLRDRVLRTSSDPGADLGRVFQ